MRLVLLTLGVLLLLQAAVHIVLTLIEGPVTFTAIGMQLDEDLVRLTAGLCAVCVARPIKTERA